MHDLNRYKLEVIQVRLLATMLGTVVTIFVPLFVAFVQDAHLTKVITHPVLSANEVRALCVVRNTLTSPERIRAMVEHARAAGFNTLIVQVRGRGDAYYRSRWEPRATTLKDQPANFDPLAVTLSEAKRRNLRVHAWINTSLLANLDELPTDPAHVYNAHPDWLAVPRARRQRC